MNPVTTVQHGHLEFSVGAIPPNEFEAPYELTCIGGPRRHLGKKFRLWRNKVNPTAMFLVAADKPFQNMWTMDVWFTDRNGVLEAR